MTFAYWSAESRKEGPYPGSSSAEGYEYVIRYERYADGSRRLLEVLSQRPAKAAREEITVGAVAR